ncbi:MAG: glycosyltransferase family 39 protein [bacterium]
MKYLKIKNISKIPLLLVKFLVNDDQYKLYLIVAVLIGIFIRFYGLDIQSLWLDEIYSTVASSSSSISKMFINWILTDVHPPLYQLFIYYWIKIFGNSEIAVRLPSAIAGTLSIFLMYFLSKRVFNKYIATSATILISFSYTAIWYSQEARSYGFLLLFSTVLTLLWLDILKEIAELKANKLIIYTFVSIITAYLHYFGAVLVFFQIIYLLFITLFWFKKEAIKILISGFIIICVFLAWFSIHFVFIYCTIGGNFWIKKPDIGFLIQLINSLTPFDIKLLLIPFFINIKTFWLKLNLLEKIKFLKPNSLFSALIYLTIFPVISLFILSQHTPILTIRNLIILLPSFYLFIAVFISLNPFFNRVKGNIFVFIFALAGLITFLPYHYSPCKSDWRGTSKYITENINNNSIIFVDNIWSTNPVLHEFYLNKFNKNNKKLIIEDFLHLKKDFSKQKYSKIFIFSVHNKLSKDKRQKLFEEKQYKCAKKHFYQVSCFEECSFIK